MRMKKLWAAAGVFVIAAGVFTGCSTTQEKDVGRDAALETALLDAGVTEEDTTRLKVSQDMDDGRKTYEIQFDANGKEYDYEVAASDGQILSVDMEELNTAQNQAGAVQNQPANVQSNTDDNSNAATDAMPQEIQNPTDHATASNGAADSNGPTSGAGNNQANVAVSLEDATASALERVEGATESDIRIKLDFDDGVYKYEGDIIYNGREYEFEIDANTGAILEWSEEGY